MVKARLIWDLENRNLLNNEQFGFRNNRSTQDCIGILENNIQNAFSKRKQITAILFDIEKAFDRTWHHLIIKTLVDMNIKGHMLHFISNFLKNRNFNIILENSRSTRFTQANGVPQGEVLSPCLFIIVLTSLANIIPKNVNYLLYADDLTIYFSSHSISSIKKQLLKTLNNIEKWSKKSGFTFSTLKTKAIHFYTRRKHNIPPDLFFNQQPINFVNSHTFLGIIFDRKLSWTPHINQLKSNTYKACNILKTLSHTAWGADRTSLIRIFDSMVQSRLDYGAIAFSSAKANLLSKLNPILNHGLRLPTGAFKSSPILSLICESGKIPLHYRRDYQVSNFLIKIAPNPFHILNPKISDINSSKSILNRSLSIYSTLSFTIFTKSTMASSKN